ncbi:MULTISPECIES: hypothetical protein [Blautia]|uniref:hypothetical protein n=1 Tax=Blautia TaxID=572511 RepID=UPI002ED5116B
MGDKQALKKFVIALNLQIDENICSMYDYFEIFLDRMMFCRKLAEIIRNREK